MDSAAKIDCLSCIEMKNRIQELEDHIRLMKKNSFEAVAFLKYHLLDCLDTKKILEEEINSIDKHPISPPVKTLDSCLKENETISKNTCLNEENERLKIELQKMKEENQRKDQKLQEIQEKLEDCQELLTTKTEKEILSEDRKIKVPEQTFVEMSSQTTQTRPVQMRNIFIRGAHRISKRCHQAVGYCRSIV